ncbi:MAG: hypothetical protein QM811_29990 [Pirellulales bacterium]
MLSLTINITTADDQTTPRGSQFELTFVDAAPKRTPDDKTSNEIRFRDALKRRVTLKTRNTSLDAIIDELNAKCDFPIVLQAGCVAKRDVPQLDLIEFRTPLTFGGFLNHLRRELNTHYNAEWDWANDALVISVCPGEEANTVVKRYAVGDLIDATPLFQHARAAARESEGRHPRTFQELIDVLRSTVDPSSWKETGREPNGRRAGESDVAVITSPPTLIVTTTFATHLKIEALLDDLRKHPPLDPWAKLVGTDVKPDQIVPLAYHLVLPERLTIAVTEVRDAPPGAGRQASRSDQHPQGNVRTHHDRRAGRSNRTQNGNSGCLGRHGQNRSRGRRPADLAQSGRSRTGRQTAEPTRLGSSYSGTASVATQSMNAGIREMPASLCARTT